MYIDQHHFLSISSDDTNPKLYTHTIAGQTISATDHQVLVRHKESFKIINRKDLGKTMQLIAITDKKSYTTSVSKNDLLRAATLFQGFDEQSGQKYYFLPKISQEQLQYIVGYYHTFSSKVQILSVDKRQIIIDDIISGDDELLMFAGLALIYGKYHIKNGSLSSLKIQIPFALPFLGQKEKIDGLIDRLQLGGYVISGYFTQQSGGGVYEITTNDYDLLGFLILYDKRLETLHEIFTKTLTDKVVLQLIHDYPDTKTIIGDTHIKLCEVK